MYYLIVPTSLLFFAAMTPEFRKLMRLPPLVVAAFISLLLLVPMYETLSYVFFPPQRGGHGFRCNNRISRCNPHWILWDAILTILGLVMSARLPKQIRAELADK